MAPAHPSYFPTAVSPHVGTFITFERSGVLSGQASLPPPPPPSSILHPPPPAPPPPHLKQLQTLRAAAPTHTPATLTPFFCVLPKALASRVLPIPERARLPPGSRPSYSSSPQESAVPSAGLGAGPGTWLGAWQLLRLFSRSPELLHKDDAGETIGGRDTVKKDREREAPAERPDRARPPQCLWPHRSCTGRLARDA